MGIPFVEQKWSLSSMKTGFIAEKMGFGRLIPVFRLFCKIFFSFLAYSHSIFLFFPHFYILHPLSEFLWDPLLNPQYLTLYSTMFVDKMYFCSYSRASAMIRNGHGWQVMPTFLSIETFSPDGMRNLNR